MEHLWAEHCAKLIHNSQETEPANEWINPSMNKSAGYMNYYLAFWKEGNAIICTHIDEPGEHYAKITQSRYKKTNTT